MLKHKFIAFSRNQATLVTYAFLFVLEKHKEINIDKN